MEVGRLYDRLFVQCTTQNQVNQLHIALENRMTPDEARELALHIEQTYTPRPLLRRAQWVQTQASRRLAKSRWRSSPRVVYRHELEMHALQWADGTVRQLEQAGSQPGASMSRVWTRGGATLYQSAAEPSGTLLVIFAGNGRGVMMPTQLFLRFVSFFGADVLKIESPRGTAYSEGVRGFSVDFPTTVDWLADYVRDRGSPDVVMLGCSGGALPALLAALQLQVASVLAAGTGAFKVAELGGPEGLEDLVAAYAACSGSRPRITLVYGDGAPNDAVVADQVSSAIADVDLVEVPDSGHACLYPLVGRGELRALLARALFVDGDPPSA